MEIRSTVLYSPFDMNVAGKGTRCPSLLAMGERMKITRLFLVVVCGGLFACRRDWFLTLVCKKEL